MAEYEGSNYTKEDLRRLNLEDFEIEELTGHSLGDGEEPSETNFEIEKDEIDDVLIVTPEGKKIYKSDDPGESYKQRSGDDSKKEETLLDKTSLKDRRYLVEGATVKRTDKHGNYRYGWTEHEAIVKRVLDENNKTIIKDNKIEYMALVEINYSYRRHNGKLISYKVEPGETFFSPKNFEDKVKREKLNSNK